MDGGPASAKAFMWQQVSTKDIMGGGVCIDANTINGAWQVGQSIEGGCHRGGDLHPHLMTLHGMAC